MADRSYKARIWGNLAAVLASRIVRAGEQIFLVPVLLSTWGIDRYGEWVAITSLAQLAYFTQFGIGSAGGSDIVMRFAAGETVSATRSFATSLLAITVVVATLGLAGYAAANVWDFASFVALKTMSAKEALAVFALTSFAVLINFYTAPIAAVISASVGAALPNFVMAVVKCLELSAIAVVLLTGGAPLHVATVMLIAAMLNVIALLFLLAIVVRWLSLKHFRPDLQSLRRTINPSIGYFLMLLSMSGLNVYVPRLVIFATYGAAGVAIFSVLVTYTRAVRMLTNIVPLAMQVEIGRAYGTGNLPRLRALLESMLTVSSWGGLMLMAGALLSAQWVVPLWTHGKVHVDWTILSFLGVGGVIGAFSDAVMFAAAGINRVLGISAWYLLGFAVGLTAGVIALPFVGPGGMAAGLIIPDLVAGWAGFGLLASLSGASLGSLSNLLSGRGNPLVASVRSMLLPTRRASQPKTEQ